MCVCVCVCVCGVLLHSKFECVHMNVSFPGKIQCVHAKLLQLCLTLFNPMDCSPPGPSVHGILQTRMLEQVAMLSPGDLPNPGIELTSLRSTCIGRCGQKFYRL